MYKSQNHKIVLWGVSASPYVRKAMVALAEKDLTYEQREILPKILLKATGQAIPVEFENISPLGKIPVLEVDDFSISESSVIAAYLEKKFTCGNNLYPKDAQAYAHALWFENYSDAILTDVIYKKIFMENVIKAKILNLEPNQKLVEEAIQTELPQLLNFLEQSLHENKWFAGEEFSVADIAISTQLLALKMAGVELNDSEYKNLSGFLNQIKSRPSFQKIF